MFEIAVDVGGTFADFVVRDQQENTFTAKVPSSLEDPLQPMIRGLTELARRVGLSLPDFLGQTEKFIHGTTVGINALLQGQGVKTALITTEGFRDALELRRSRLAEQWNFRQALPPVLVPRFLRLGLRERLDYRGVPLKAVDSAQVSEIAAFLEQERVEAVAVCLLFACRNPEHEIELKERLQALLPDLFITLSSELSSQLGEYERTTTTVLNARLSPVLSHYLQDLRTHLRAQGLRVPISIAQNNGGLTDLEQASKRAVHSLFSGPAGGLKGGWALAHEQGLSELVVADMGGTSFDVSLIRQGKMEVTPEAEIAGYPVQLPMLDIHTVGAGGGSIAWLDKGGMLRVGPQSAGAKPGPVCYGLGGQEPTITDAALIMGLLDSTDFLGGRMKLDAQRAYRAIETHIARPLGLSVHEAAYAIYQVALSLMVDAVYLMTVKKGLDPRSFALAAVGGALPLFATALAAGVGIQRIEVPDLAPVFCAQGLHYARFQFEVLRSVYEELGKELKPQWYDVLAEMQRQADQELTRLGVNGEQRRYIWSADLKYPDQHHELNIDLSCDLNDPAVWQQLKIDFHAAHQKLYGYNQPEKSLELVNLRLLAQEKDEPSLDRRRMAKEAPDKNHEMYGAGGEMNGAAVQTAPARIKQRPVYWRGAFQEMNVFPWQGVAAGRRIEGPALIQKAYTTILLEEHCQAEKDRNGNLTIVIGKSERMGVK